jgi:hypothetical protein
MLIEKITWTKRLLLTLTFLSLLATNILTLTSTAFMLPEGNVRRQKRQ